MDTPVIRTLSAVPKGVRNREVPLYLYEGGSGGGVLCLTPEEVGYDIGLTQYHMTMECSLERFWGVAFLMTGAQPAMAMKSVPFCLTCEVADNVLDYSLR